MSLSGPIPSVSVDEVELHVLCNVCQKICTKSKIIQAYVTSDSSKSHVAIAKHCWSSAIDDRFPFYSILWHQLSYEAGCHLCTILWYSSGRQHRIFERTEQSKDKTLGGPALTSMLVVTCRGFNYSVDLDLREMVNGKLSAPKFWNLGTHLRDDQEAPFPNPSFRIQASTHPTPEKTGEIVRFWLNECSTKHDVCEARYDKPSAMNYRPTRLINVTDLDHPWLDESDPAKLCHVQYITLSHCWPKDFQSLKLSKENLKALKSEIPIMQLSQTFRDAIAITKASGYSYLWIDCLCIIQNWPEDWSREAVLMAYVYGNADFNLVAYGTSENSSMLGPRNPLAYHPCRLSRSGPRSLWVEPYVLLRCAKNARVFERGWILQERLMSRRNIHFSRETIVWECFEGCATETQPRVRRTTNDGIDSVSGVQEFDQKTIFLRLLEAAKCLKSDDSDVQQTARVEFCRMWGYIVMIYSHNNLTFAGDKLTALADMAMMLGQTASMEYIAGIWMSLLPAALLWYKGDFDPPLARPPWRGAPTWSWASLDCDIRGNWPEQFDMKTLSKLPEPSRWSARVLDCQVRQSTNTAATYGEVAEAKLHVAGVLRPVDVAFHEDCDIFSHDMFLSPLVKSVLFQRDVEIAPGTRLFYLTIVRGRVMYRYEDPLKFGEEGLVLIPHSDGYVRVGMMSVYFNEEGESALTELLWGNGKEETVILY